MREIKFRAISKEDNKMIFGNLVDSGATKVKSFFILPYLADNYDEVIEVNPETVGQFTGLHDKNGKEIYEGDVLGYTDVYSETLHTVIFTNGKFIANNRIRPNGNEWLSDNGKSYDLCFLTATNNYEIIGNIYENTDLLK